jgi:5,10-methylenetetrahydromethanopterin reductase
MPVVQAQARAAEAAGATTLWASDHLFLREPVAMAAAALAVTSRPRVALMAMSPHVVHPVQIAMAAASLDELAPGRVILCLGTGAPRDLADAGIEPRRGLRTLHEAVEIVRALLAGETVARVGEVFPVRGRRLATGARRVPVFLAASGPRTLELAGAVADGVLLSNASSVEFVRWALEQVERGARGRHLARTGLVYACVADRETDALARYRRHLAVTLRGAHHALNVQLGGGRLDQARLHDAVARQDWALVEGLVTDDLVRRHTACGTAERVGERLAAYRAAGLDEIVLGGLADPDETARTLAVARHGD